MIMKPVASGRRQLRQLDNTWLTEEMLPPSNLFTARLVTEQRPAEIKIQKVMT